MPTTRGAPDVANGVRTRPLRRDRRARREHAWRIGAFAAVIGAAALFIGEATARGGRSAEVLTYRARNTASLDALEPTSRSAHASQTVRRPVTDLILRLRSPENRPIETVLAAPDHRQPGQTTFLFAAELIIAAAGRIHVEDRAACGPWQANTSICRTECDGGAFAIVRRDGAAGQSLTLMLGRAPSIQEAGFGDTVRLGACNDDEAPGGLAARGGGMVEISLDPR